MSYQYLRKPNTLATIALGGLTSALLALLPIILPPLFALSYFAPLPLFLLGLSQGLRPLLMAGALATTCILLCQLPLLAIEYCLLFFLSPAFVVQRMLVNWKEGPGKVTWYPLSYLLRDTTLFAGLILTFALGGYLYFTQGLNLQAIARTIMTHFDPEGYFHGAELVLVNLFPLLPGLLTFSWMLLLLLNTTIAQGLLSRKKANLRPSSTFEELEIPKSFFIAFALSIFLSFIGVGTLELIGKNGAIVLAFPFFLSGLGVVHALLNKTSFARVGLVAFYCMLIMSMWLSVIVVFIGMLRPWMKKGN